ncbi:MAG: hypothetical protein ACYTFQ_23730 [Planctomycetota bacterium]
MKLADRLGTLPSGKVLPLSDTSMRRWFEEKYIASPTETRRRKEAELRLDFYNDLATDQIEEDINQLFKNNRVREWRKELIPFAEFQNLTRRVVNEISTVYSEPATRNISNGDDKYQEFQRIAMMDRRMRRVNRMVNLCNDALVYFHVRPDDRDTPVMNTITPDQFWAVSHPNDPTWLVAVIIDQTPRGLEVKDSDPHYLVLAEEEWFKLDKNIHLIPSTYTQHDLGRIPITLIQRELREDTILDATSGRDLISAHRAIALLNVLMLKHQKSGTKMAVAQGDTSDMARGQPMDEESLLEAPDGVALSTLDMGADPDTYITAARAVIKQIAANRGIPESVFDLSYQATSGFEIELKRVGLREVRREQIVDYRQHERDQADLQSKVLASKSHGYTFSTEGWRIDFGEVETPQEPIAKLTYWDKLWEMGLANPVEMYLHQNPEATAPEALAAVERNVEMRLAKVREYQQASAAIDQPDGNGGDVANGEQQTAPGEDIPALVTAATALIRAGFKPDAALAAVGLSPIDHYGLLPVTLKVDGEDGEEEEEEEPDNVARTR